MAATPETRLARLARHARMGWRAARRDPALRQQAYDWLLAHPSPRRDVDLAWLFCLQNRGPLAKWLRKGEPPEAWKGSPPLHTLLSSHPFPFLHAWLSQRTSRES